MRPAKGKLGNAPRTLSISEPMRKYFDLSIQKDFPMPWIGGEGKRKINFRVDALNVFNMPNFYFNSRGNTPFGFGGFPTEFNGTECIANTSIVTPTTANCPGGTRSSPISAAEYDAWAALASNNQPLSTYCGGRSPSRTDQDNGRSVKASAACRVNRQVAERCLATFSPLHRIRALRQRTRCLMTSDARRIQAVASEECV